MRAPPLPADWRAALATELAAPYYRDVQAFVAAERAAHPVFPPAADVFAALALTPLAAVKVVLLGQDPYHADGQAHGLAFSVPPGVPPPPSLANILKELNADLGLPPPGHGCLRAWARQGVLLLNTVLTVRAHAPHSHRGRGWERFTDAVIRAVNAQPAPVVFLLWGAPAGQKAHLIAAGRHAVFTAPHPSPLAAYRGFFGARPFSRANVFLARHGRDPVDWRLPPC